MRALNDDMGILPLNIFAMEFSVFSAGITFLMLNRDEIPAAFAALTVGSVNFLFLILTYRIIETATTSHKIISQCWSIAGDSITDPMMSGVKDKRPDMMRKALKFYLTTDGAVPAKAGDNIVIDRTLILSFFSHLIPFTVMLFTTVKEFEQQSSLAANITG